jgi:hypothetical protein
MARNKRRTSVGALAASILVVHVLATSGSAQQGQSGMIVGTVHDASGAIISGAAISVSSPSLIGGVQTATTARDGTYRLPALSPGEYVVTAWAAGFRPKQRGGLQLLAGATATTDFALTVAGVEETVTVTAATVVPLDVRTSASTTIISRTMLDNLPLSRTGALPNWTVSSYANLVPGVVKDVAFGGSLNANPFLIDGIPANEVDYGTPTAEPSASWMEQIQVVTVGADAQFGDYTGARTNAITRSGSNALAGSVDFWTTRPTWTADNRGSLTPALASRFRPLESLDRWSLSAQLGGAVRKDRAWIFGGFDLFRNVNRPAGFASTANPPEDTVYSLTEPKWFGKLTAAPGQPVRLEGFVARDYSTSLGSNASPVVKPEALKGDHRPEWLWNARATWVVSDRTLFEVQTGGHNSHDVSGPADPSGTAGPPGHVDTITNVQSVNYSSFSDLRTRQVLTSAALTRYVNANRNRAHQIKAGFEFEFDGLREYDGYSGGMVYYDKNGQPDTVDIQAPTTWRPDQRRESLYVQDAWSASDRITINAGARFSFYQGAITGYPTQFSASSFAPRLGAAWDPLADHTLAVRGHYGRYHEQMVTSFYEFLDPLSQQASIEGQVTGPNQYTVISRNDPTDGTYSIDPNIRYPYADEWIAGIDRAFSHHVSLTAQYIGRRFGSIAGFVGSMANWTPVRRQDPGPDGVLGTGDDGGFTTIYFNPGTLDAVLTNPDGAYKHYNGVQLIGTRRANDRWEGQLSYTWSRTRATFDNAMASNAANNDLSVNGVYVNPNRALFDEGRTSFDFTHEIKALGTVELPWNSGVRLSGVYRYQTGLGWGRRVNFSGPTQFGGAGELVEPRGSQEVPATNVCDLRVEKIFKVAGSKIGGYLDVFNVTNQGVALAVNPISGPNLGVPARWSDPRVVRAGVRVNF